MFRLSAWVDVLNCGYRWHTGRMVPHGDRGLSDEEKRAAGLRLLPASASPGGALRRYNPFETYPALFLNFSAIEPTESGILDFANEYGCRWPKRGPMIGPCLLEYRMAIAEMQAAVSLWRSIRADDKEQLAQHVEWSGRKLRYLGPLAGSEINRSFHVTDAYKIGDLLAPAIDQLDYAIFSRTRCTTRFQPDRDSDGAVRVLFWIEEDFFTVLWCQLLLAVMGQSEFKQCAFCQRWFPLDAPAGKRRTREDRAFCSDSCRVRAHNKRRAKAEELYRLGKKLKEISKATGTDIETVKNWISPPKEK